MRAGPTGIQFKCRLKVGDRLVKLLLVAQQVTEKGVDLCRRLQAEKFFGGLSLFVRR